MTMDPDKEDDPYAPIAYGDFGSYMRHKKQKLQIQQDEAAGLAAEDVSQIFEGVIVYINGYTDPPIHSRTFSENNDCSAWRRVSAVLYDELLIIEIHAKGISCKLLTDPRLLIPVSKSKITHIIASNLTQAKMKEFRNYKVAKPEWITESIKANKLLPWHKFSTLRVPNSLSKFEAGSSDASPSQAPRNLTQATTEPATPPRSISQKSPEQLLSPILDDGIIVSREVAPVNPVNERRTLEQEYTSGQRTEADIQDQDDWGEFPFEDSFELIPGLSQSGLQVPSLGGGKDIPEEDDFMDLDLEHLESPLGLISPEQARKPVILSPLTSILAVPAPRPDPIIPQNNPISIPQRLLSSAPVKPILFNPYRRTKMPSPVAKLSGEPLAGDDPPLDEEVEISENDTRHPTLIELSVPWNRQNSSVQPGFVEKFYQSSRLHYLSTWKAKLRELTTELQKDHAPIPSKSKHRTIMHIDFDCFFASVATRGKPELAGKAIGVAHGSGGSTSNSEIASCNYIARKFGVKNGMHLKSARELCPDLIVVPYEFQQYEEISLEFYRILLLYADEMQAVSVDEALLDISSICEFEWDEVPGSSKGRSGRTRLSPEAFAQKMRGEIYKATGCHASVGIGPNILLAKLSTKRAKPHGQYIWPGPPGSDVTIKELEGYEELVPDSEPSQDDEDDPTPPGAHTGQELVSQPILPILPPSGDPKARPRKGLAVKDLPGVGRKIARDLEERYSVRTLSELLKVPRESLRENCGMKTGDMLYKSCRGIDDATIASDRDKARQSVSAEISWGVRFENQQQVDIFMRDLSVEVSKRLKEIDRMGKAVVLKIMKRSERIKGSWKHLGHGPVEQYARTGQLAMFTDDPEIIAKEALSLLRFHKFSVLDIRGLGIQMLKLNNETTNIFSKSAYLNLDTRNQTTLSAAMFQPKQTSSSASRPNTGSGGSNQGQGDPMIDPMPPPAPLPPPKRPRLEIDAATFKEFPTDIQKELMKENELVLLNQESFERSHPVVPSSNHHVNDQAGHTERDAKRAPLPPWSQLDPEELIAMPTPVMRDSLREYAGRKPGRQEEKKMGNSVLPSPSRLDRSVLQALPDDIRAEIEQEYTRLMESHEQMRKPVPPGLLPPPPPPLPPPLPSVDQGASKTRGSTRGRPRGSASSSRGRSRGRGRGKGQDMEPSHLGGGSADLLGLEMAKKGNPLPPPAPPPLIPDLDAEFLAALPQDIRAEVVSAHQIELIKLRQKLGISKSSEDRSRSNTGRAGQTSASAAALAATKGSSAPQRPTLEGERELGPLRKMLTAWVESTLTMDLVDEGPDPKDVQTFSDFLARVLFMERDLERVRLLLVWLRRKVIENEKKVVLSDENLSRQGPVKVLMTWSRALEEILFVVQHLVRQIYGGDFVLD